MNDYTSPDNKHSALIIIDVQRDFTLPAATAEIPGTIQVVPNIQQLAQKYRKNSYPIIHVIRLYHQDGSSVDLCRNCPRTTIYEASERDFKIVLVKDATSQMYDKALEEIMSIGVSVMETRDYIKWLELICI